MLIMFALLASLLNVQPSSMLLTNPHELSSTEQFDDNVNQWIAELSEQDEFTAWKKPEVHWDKHALGPGLHGWIVILTNHDQEIGYIVVTADPKGSYHLSEYGQGEYPLFSENTLYQSLVQHELIDSSLSLKQYVEDNHLSKERIYFNPLQSIWLVTIDQESYQIDAKTGDLMSIDSEILERAITLDTVQHSWTAPSEDTQHVQHSLQVPASDPYFDLGWILKTPNKIKDLQQLQAYLQSGQSLTFITNLYENTVVYALSVTGYHQWNGGDPFIALEHNGTRYIPVQHLMETGRYFLNTQ